MKDEYTREIVNLEVGTSFKSGDVIAALQKAFKTFGTPELIRSDNGSEFVALQLQAELAGVGVTSKFIEPGKPWQNGFVEGFNSRFRAEFLSQSVFASLSEAQVLCESFRRYFNDERLHSSLGYCPPSEFRAGLTDPRCGKSAVLALIE